MFSELMNSFIIEKLFFSLVFKNTRDVKGTVKGKSTTGESSSGKLGSRCNNKYFGHKIRELDEHKKKIIRDHGFGSCLSMMDVQCLETLSNGLWIKSMSTVVIYLLETK